MQPDKRADIPLKIKGYYGVEYVDSTRESLDHFVTNITMDREVNNEKCLIACAFGTSALGV